MRDILKDKECSSPVNKVRISGEILENFSYSFKTLITGKYFETKIKVDEDTIIPIMVPEEYIIPDHNYIGKYIEVKGKFSNAKRFGNNVLPVFIIAEYINIFDTNEDLPYENEVFISGNTLKEGKMIVNGIFDKIELTCNSKEPLKNGKAQIFGSIISCNEGDNIIAVKVSMYKPGGGA